MLFRLHLWCCHCAWCQQLHPVPYACSSAQDLANSIVHSAVAICCFPRLFSVPTLNAAVTVVTGAERMHGLCPSSASLSSQCCSDHSKGWRVCFLVTPRAISFRYVQVHSILLQPRVIFSAQMAFFPFFFSCGQKRSELGGKKYLNLLPTPFPVGSESSPLSSHALLCSESSSRKLVHAGSVGASVAGACSLFQCHTLSEGCVTSWQRCCAGSSAVVKLPQSWLWFLC